MIAIRGFIELIIYLAIVAIIIELILPKGNTKKYVYVITVQPDEFEIEVRTTEWDDVDAVVGDIIF